MAEAGKDKLFCPIHGDYPAPSVGTRCPICAEDPIASQASLRAVKVITTAEMPPGVADDDEPTSIDDVAPCPSCGKLTQLDQFQTEAPGEVWEGDAALWAEEGVCTNCYRDVIPQISSAWSTDEWLSHHFEGWNSQVRRVHEIVEHGTSEQDSWLPEEQRHKILDVERTLAARREHLARSQMRLREIKSQLGVEELPEHFAAALVRAKHALNDRAVERLKERREDDLAIERERRVDSMEQMSPRAALEEAGLDADRLLKKPTGNPTPATASLDDDVPAYSRGRWPLLVVVAAVIAFAIWWFIAR